MRTPHLTILLLAVPLFSACSGGAEPVAQELPKTSTLTDVEARILAEPDNAALYGQRALLFEAIDSLRRAESDWKRAIVLDSTNSRWRIALGDLYFRKVRMLDAEQRFNEAIRLAPDSIEGRSKLSEVFLAQHRFSEAMTIANEALRLDPQDARLYNLKGWIHRAAGDTALAISSYQTALERDPALYDAYISLGILHAAKNDPLALQYYASALEVRPNSVEALYNKAMYAQEHGLDSVALACYMAIKAIEPRYPLAWYNTGYVLLEHQGKHRAARSEFARAIELLPEYPQAYYSRALTFELDQQYDSAYMDFRKALTLAPGMTEAAQGVGRMQAKGVEVSAR